METGLVLSLLGAGISIIGGGIGTIIGTYYVASTGAAVVSKNANLFGSVLLSAAVPSSQGIYGFLGAILITQQTGFLAGDAKMVDPSTGWAFVLAALPVAILGLVSGIGQGKVLQSGLKIVVNNPGEVGKSVILGVLMESMAVFGLLLTILIINNIKL